MVEHARRHTGEKSVVCRECGKTFRHLSTFYRHKKIPSRTRLKKGEQAEAGLEGQPDCGHVLGGDLKTAAAGNRGIQVGGEVYGEAE